MYFLYANPHKEETVAVAQKLTSMLLALGERVLLDSWLYERVGLGEQSSLAEMDEGVQALISLGGDGTLLRTIPYAASRNIPVLGVHMGRVGFLLEGRQDELEEMVQRLRTKSYQIDHRAMLTCRVNGGPEHLVMNDAVLCRGGNPSSIVVDAFADGELIYSTHGDGIMVSTATGSTGYCLSAGGPVLHPDLQCMVVLPICTHKAQQLPIILKEDTVVTLRAPAIRDRAHQVVLDGQITFSIPEEAELEVRRSQTPARFIRFGPQQFYTRLRLKQAEWSGK